jgi:hypothetical protein
MKLDEHKIAAVVQTLGKNRSPETLKRNVCTIIDAAFAEAHGLHTYANAIQYWCEEREIDHISYFTMKFGALNEYRERPHFDRVLKFTVEHMIWSGHLTRTHEPHIFRTTRYFEDWVPNAE